MKIFDSLQTDDIADAERRAAKVPNRWIVTGEFMRDAVNLVVVQGFQCAILEDSRVDPARERTASRCEHEIVAGNPGETVTIDLA